MTVPLVELDGVSVDFRVRGGAFQRRTRVHAVDGVTLHIDAGETLGLIGESGSGKTTLARVVAGLIEPTRGALRYRGSVVAGSQGVVSNETRRDYRRNVQLVLQDPSDALDPRMTARQCVAEPLAVQRRGERTERDPAALALLDCVGFGADLADRLPHELSGGQKQRVSIARALALDPALIVCDEPVSALDVSLQAQILNLLAALQRDRGLAYLFVSHDLAVVAHLARRVAVMYLGRLMELGPVGQVLTAPAHPYTRALLSAQPRYGGDQAGRSGERILLIGEIPSPLAPPSGCRFRTRCPWARAECAVEEPVWRQMGGSDRWIACHFADQHQPASA